MSSDPNKKSARTFQCRDVLWETFEQMARELECSVDYLINEAMKQYARQRSYGTRTPFPGGQGREGAGTFPPPSVPSSAPRTGPPPPVRPAPAPPPGAMPMSRPLPAPPGMSSRPMGGGMGGSLPAPPPRSTGGLGLPPVPPRSVPPVPPRSVPPPIPRSSGPMGNNGGYDSSSAGQGMLALVYNGEKMAVSKDRFVIGRGKQSSDLTLKDPNVSRQHAMVEFQNGLYFMVDMGSTNGIEFNGQRIARKQINEGDVFRICDHDILFTYR
jgi:neural Wiskott-Aldrich syndrome protein